MNKQIEEKKETQKKQYIYSNDIKNKNIEYIIMPINQQKKNEIIQNNVPQSQHYNKKSTSSPKIFSNINNNNIMSEGKNENYTRKYFDEYNNLNYEKNYYKLLLKKFEKKEKNEEIEKIKKDEINNLKIMEKNKKNNEKDYNLNYYDFSKKPKKKHIYETIIKQTKYDYEKFPTYLRYDILKGKKIKIDKNDLNKDVKEDENYMIANQEKKHIISNLNISEKIFYNKYKHREKNLFDEFKPYKTSSL
jgi:hypothetical protein